MICWRWWNCVIGIQSRVESTLERESWTEFFWLQDRGSKTVLILESMSCIPDSRYWISLSLSQWNLESGFQSLLGFCYSHSCIPDSKAPVFRIPQVSFFLIPADFTVHPDSPPWGESARIFLCTFPSVMRFLRGFWFPVMQEKTLTKMV